MLVVDLEVIVFQETVLDMMWLFGFNVIFNTWFRLHQSGQF